MNNRSKKKAIYCCIFLLSLGQYQDMQSAAALQRAVKPLIFFATAYLGVGVGSIVIRYLLNKRASELRSNNCITHLGLRASICFRHGLVPGEEGQLKSLVKNNPSAANERYEEILERYWWPER